MIWRLSRVCSWWKIRKRRESSGGKRAKILNQSQSKKGVNLAQRCEILSSKNCRKEEAKEEGQEVFRRHGGGFSTKKVIKSFTKFLRLLAAGSK